MADADTVRFIAELLAGKPPPLTPQQRINSGFVPYGGNLGLPLSAGQIIATEEPPLRRPPGAR